MSDVIKAIETTYDGYKFRSRTEARWAVFLNAMEEPYGYEVQGYDVGCACYLPDFWIPRLNCFIEIKGGMPTELEFAKAEGLRDTAGRAVAMFSGLPCETWGTLFCWDADGATMLPAILCDGRSGLIGLGLPKSARNKTLFMDAERRHQLYPRFVPDLPRSVSAKAVEKAKQARFEHGETPTPRHEAISARV